MKAINFLQYSGLVIGQAKCVTGYGFERKSILRGGLNHYHAGKCTVFPRVKCCATTCHKLSP